MTGQNPLRILVPMKPAYEGKSRLADVLDADGRAALSLHLLRHVLSVAARVAGAETWVIGGDAWVQHVAALESATWQQDTGGGLNDALRPAIRACCRETWGFWQPATWKTWWASRMASGGLCWPGLPRTVAPTHCCRPEVWSWGRLSALAASSGTWTRHGKQRSR